MHCGPAREGTGNPANSTSQNVGKLTWASFTTCGGEIANSPTAGGKSAASSPAAVRPGAPLDSSAPSGGSGDVNTSSLSAATGEAASSTVRWLTSHSASS